MMTEGKILEVVIRELTKYHVKGLLEYIEIDDSYSISLTTERDSENEVNFGCSVDLTFKQWIPYEDYCWSEHTFTLFNIHCLNDVESLSEALKYDLDRKVVEDEKEAIESKLDCLRYLSDEDKDHIARNNCFTIMFNTKDNEYKVIIP